MQAVSRNTGRRVPFRRVATGLGLILATGVPLTSVQALTPSELRQQALSRTNSLKTIAVADAPNFKQFVQNRDQLRILGKALFWDQQAGSDGQACSSCHFHAGADNRSKNQLDPGLRNTTPGANVRVFNDPTGFGPNLNHFGPDYQLLSSDFPFHRLANVNDRESGVLSDTNDIASSQGVFDRTFAGLNKALLDQGVPNTTPSSFADIFSVDGHLVRNVEPRNTPTVVNAVLNHRNFWDSRARNEFNGVNPIGSLDPTTRLVKAVPVGPGRPNNAVLVQVRISDSSAASQADGPPLSNLEMSFDGRRFPEVGRKMLALTPLGQQVVATDDSVLGTFSNQSPPGGPGTKGISLKYADLIKAAFDPRWWDAPGWVVDLSSGKPVLVQGTPGPNKFTVMEYNFSLYFGMAVNEYEKLLVANDSPFDRFMEGADAALDPQQQQGLELFLTKGRCISCHSGAEFTNASLTNVRNEMLERMIMGNDRVAVYDTGHYNIGVRPTLEDLGIGATIGPNNLPLSNSRLFQNCVKDKLAASPSLGVAQANSQCGVPRIPARPAEAALLLSKTAALLPDGDPTRLAAEALIAQAQGFLTAVPPDPVAASCALARNVVLCGLGAPAGAADLLGAVASPPVGFADLLAAAIGLLPDQANPGTAADLRAPPLQPNERVAVDGAFKTPTIRNTELTAPYFHNGGQATLQQVVEFYNRGGDFATANEQNLDPDIAPIGFTDEEKAAVVAFLMSTTDPRVKFERAPFDRPSLNIPNGGGTALAGLFGGACPVDPPNVCVADDRLEIPAVGAGGHPEPLGTANLPSPYANFLDPLK